MAAKDEGADRTELPTPKRLRDARKEGQVHKSKELTSTVLLLLLLVMLAMLASGFATRTVALTDAVLFRLGEPFAAVWTDLLMHGAALVFFASAIALLVPAAVAAFVEFLQTGPVFALKRVVPQLSHINPTDGLKRIFSMDNAFALVMALIKTVLLCGIGYFVLMRLLPDMTGLSYATPAAMVESYWHGARLLGIGVVVVFFFVSAFDAWYQHYSFIKQLKMSRRDIRQEYKDNEGDPMIRSKRRELHQEWARQNTFAAVRGASVVVTNPTHYAVALHYEPGKTELPLVVAKGEDYDAREIRRVAEEAGVPIMENVELARGMYAEVDIDQFVPSKFFQAVAEVLRWAEQMRQARAESSAGR